MHMQTSDSGDGSSWLLCKVALQLQAAAKIYECGKCIYRHASYLTRCRVFPARKRGITLGCIQGHSVSTRTEYVVRGHR
jgi:hypothetical protein